MGFVFLVGVVSHRSRSSAVESVTTHSYCNRAIDTDSVGDDDAGQSYWRPPSTSRPPTQKRCLEICQKPMTEPLVLITKPLRTNNHDGTVVDQ
jgi:hypothetical protein